MFRRLPKVLWIWNKTGVSKWWLLFHFWMNSLFKVHDPSELNQNDPLLCFLSIIWCQHVKSTSTTLSCRQCQIIYQTPSVNLAISRMGAQSLDAYVYCGAPVLISPMVTRTSSSSSSLSLSLSSSSPGASS